MASVAVAVAVAAVVAAVAVVGAVVEAVVVCCPAHSVAGAFVDHVAELDRAVGLEGAVGAVADVDIGRDFVADPSAGSGRVVELGLLVDSVHDLAVVHFGADVHDAPFDFVVF